MTVSDPDLRAEYVYLVRGFLRLATQFEHDMAEKKRPDNDLQKLRRDKNANVLAEIGLRGVRK